jgi:hypothetical protein
MTEQSSKRYEIREQEPSADIVRLYPDMAYPLYVVWDLELDKRVPFGNYRERTRAEGRIERLEARDAG